MPMRRNFLLSVLVACFLVACQPKPVEVDPLLGHWGCETYISCRTEDDGAERWDTLHYEVGTNRGYEVWFRSDGSGKIRLNESPAFIKDFAMTFEHDTEHQEIVVHGSAWLFALYGSLYMEENEARFQVESLDTKALTLSWINYISEEQPFFERFYLKRINNQSN